ncbi:MAG: ROK family protein [Phycisphaeraceae bacterium]|nr:ROK family protein [Phycisphaeraceae bacterium]
MHERWVFERLRLDGLASRAELAKATGLSAPTVGKVVEGLLATGLVEEVKADVGEEARTIPGAGTFPGAGVISGGLGVGRPARPVRLNRTRKGIVALQLGVNHTRLAYLAVSGAQEGEEERWLVEFDTPKSAEAWQMQLAEAVRGMGSVGRTTKGPSRGGMASGGASGGGGVQAVMVSVPGIVDEGAGKVLLSPNLHWLEEADLAEWLGRIWHGPVLLMQEIRALALGHLWADRNKEDFLLVDFGAGVGGAAVVKGKLYEGPMALSGELGHAAVLGNERMCGCGGQGCLETLASRRGMLASFHEAGGKGGWKELVTQVSANRGTNKKTLSGSLPGGGPGTLPGAGELAGGWLEGTIRAIGATIGASLNVMGIRRVIVTGAINEFPVQVLDELRDAVNKSAMWARFGSISVEAARRRRAGGLVAAAIERVIMPTQTWDVGETA